MTAPKFPMTVQVGHTIVKIYYSTNRINASYSVVYYVGNKRIRKNFANLELATTWAQAIATQISNGEVRVLQLKNEDQFAYARAMQSLAPTGVPIDIAASHFAEAFAILGADRLVEAARFFKKHHPTNTPAPKVPKVFKELLESKEQDGLADVYLKDLRGRLGRFAEAFKDRDINLVTAADIEDFLRCLKVKKGKLEVPASARSRNNYRRLIATLLYFAESRGYLPRGLVEVEAVAIAKENHSDIEIFQPAELLRILSVAEATAPALIPFLTIGAFAGVRHAELSRLDWSEIRLEDGFIEVKATKAKTASRRLAPITDNLKRWLEPYRQVEGPVVPFANMSKQIDWLAKDVDQAWRAENPPGKFQWKHNALRHSFISYRVAQIQNVAQVALEAGNSPRMIFSNYRELVRPKDAETWFSITPEPTKAAAQPPAESQPQPELPQNIVFLSSAVGR